MKAFLHYWLRRILGLLCVVGSFGTLGCSLDVPYENQFSDPDAITTSERAAELLATAYAQIPDASFELSLLTDDFEPTELLVQNVELSNLYRWQPQAIETLGLSLWQGYYGAIAIANAMIERVALISSADDKERVQLHSLVAEAQVLKAYCLFDLLRLFAPDYGDGADRDGVVLKEILPLEFLPRSDIKTCVSHIRTLLVEASVSDFKSRGEYFFSPTSRDYLRAELELYAHRYDEAALYAQSVLEALGGYEVLGEKAYESLWTDMPCGERIFSRFVAQPYYTDINMTRAKGDYVRLNPQLMTLYAPLDIRRGATEYVYELSDDTLHPRERTRHGLGKYNKANKLQSTFRTVTRHRASGACLLLAEAACRQGDTSRGASVLTEYLVQRKATRYPVTELDKDGLLTAILEERRKEYVGEGGRYYDLKRLRSRELQDWSQDAPATVRRNIAPSDYRWTFPIPKSEYLYNDHVRQNEGWSKIER